MAQIDGDPCDRRHRERQPERGQATPPSESQQRDRDGGDGGDDDRDGIAALEERPNGEAVVIRVRFQRRADV